jgi:hypothetical protein
VTEPAATAAASTEAGKGRVIGAHVLVVLASILAVLSLLAGYLRFQAFDQQTFKQTAAELIAEPSIRDQVAAAMVDQLYSNVNVQAALSQRLPPNLQPLAAPIAGALPELSTRAAERILARPRAQTLFVDSALVTQEGLLRVLDNRGKYIQTSGGLLVLNLRPLVIQLGDQVAIIKNVASALPPQKTQITIMKATQLESAQKVTKLLKASGIFLWLISLACAIAAVWLARGRRRRMLREVAIGTLIAGFLVLVLRKLAGHYIVTHLVKTDSVRPAASDAWRILTQLLADGAWTLIALSLIMLLGVWVAGDTKTGRRTREWLAGPLAKPEIAFGSVAAFVVLIIWWGPTPQTHRWYVVLLGTVLLAAGMEALRRQMATESALVDG